MQLAQGLHIIYNIYTRWWTAIGGDATVGQYQLPRFRLPPLNEVIAQAGKLGNKGLQVAPLGPSFAPQIDTCLQE